MQLYSIAVPLIVLAAAPLGGADETPAAPQLEVLNVVAVDGHGQPVTDLTADDFEVTDSGKRQVISYFHHTDSKLWDTSALPPNILSNRRSGGLSSATVILFDMFNERFGTRGNASVNLVKYLEHLQNADSLFLYILTLDGKLYPVHGVPSGEEPIQHGGPPWTKQARQIMDGAFRTLPKLLPVGMNDPVRIQETYMALAQLAVQLSSIPGRKNIVWITDGVPLSLGPRRSLTGEFVDFTPELRQLSQALDRCETAIYPVRQVMLGSPDAMDSSAGEEPGGLTGPGASRNPPGGGGSGGGSGKGGSRSASNNNNDSGLGDIQTVDEFAGLTGGRADAGKDIGKAIDQAMNDARTSYQIGYIPGPENWDDKLHKLHVTSSRKGVHLQAKTSYYAWRLQPGPRTDWAITSAATSLYDSAEIGVRAGVMQNPANVDVAHVEAHIDGGDIAFLKDGASYSAHLRVAIAAYTTDGQTEKSATVPINLHFSLEERDKALKEGVITSQDVQMQANTRKLRFIVFDEASNAVGAVTIPVVASSKP